MPKMSVRPTERRKSRTPYDSPFRAWPKKSGTNTTATSTSDGPPSPSSRQGAAGAGIGDVGDLVDRHVVEAARHFLHLAHVDERLDDVVRLGIEAEAAPRAVELHLGDGVDQSVLVPGVTADRLQRPHDDLGRVVALAGEPVWRLVVELRLEIGDELPVRRTVELRSVEVTRDDAERRLALGWQHVGLREEAGPGELDRLLQPEVVVLLHEVHGVGAGEEGVHGLGARLLDLGEIRRVVRLAEL